MFDDAFDRSKSAKTKAERGIDFVEARGVWLDKNAIKDAPAESSIEPRFLAVGETLGKVWAVFYTYRLGLIRIFSVRPARDYERKAYEESKED